MCWAQIYSNVCCLVGYILDYRCSKQDSEPASAQSKSHVFSVTVVKAVLQGQRLCNLTDRGDCKLFVSYYFTLIAFSAFIYHCISDPLRSFSHSVRDVLLKNEP